MKKTSKVLITASVAALAWILSAAAADSIKTSKNTVTENTLVHLTTVYESCGHSIKTNPSQPARCINQTPSDAAASLGGQLESFENNILSVKCKDGSFCDSHYRTFLDGSTIKVQVLRTGEICKEFPTAPSQFSENDLKMLKSGIVSNSDAELSALIEDFTG